MGVGPSLFERGVSRDLERGRIVDLVERERIDELEEETLVHVPIGTIDAPRLRPADYQLLHFSKVLNHAGDRLCSMGQLLAAGDCSARAVLALQSTFESIESGGALFGISDRSDIMFTECSASRDWRLDRVVCAWQLGNTVLRGWVRLEMGMSPAEPVLTASHFGVSRLSVEPIDPNEHIDPNVLRVLRDRGWLGSVEPPAPRPKR